MIVLGAILPHPPILLPQIAQGREVHAQSTRDAYDVVGQRLRALDVERLLMISTHGIVTLNRFHILDADPSGDFGRFGHPSLTFGHAHDAELTHSIIEVSKSEQIPLTPTATWEQSDHSIGVPLTLLHDALPAKVAVVSISFRPPHDHLRFGHAIGMALRALPERTAIIASGDAVHRLNDDSPKGPHPRGPEVQRRYETSLERWDPDDLLSLDDALRRDVDESVISPTLILMGATAGMDVRPHILSSEHPWGVGYVTALIESAPASERGHDPATCPREENTGSQRELRK